MSRFLIVAIAGALALAVGLVIVSRSAPVAAAGDVVLNGSFETGTNDNVENWRTSVERDKHWKTEPFPLSREAYTGQNALEIPNPGEKGMAIAVQEIEPGKIVLGKPITLRATVRAPRSGQVHVLLAFKQHGEQIKERMYNTGGKYWERLKRKFEVPMDADPASFRVEIIRHPFGPGKVLVDDVSLKFD